MTTKHKKKKLIKTTLIILIVLATIAAAIYTTQMVTQKNKLFDLLIPNDSNKIAAYNQQSNIKLSIDNPYEQIRIVHFGDSHIQAGTFTKKLRELFSNYLGEQKQSEGYIFPFNLAKTNSPCTYTFETNAEWTFDKLTINKNNIDAGIAGIYLQTTTPNSTLTLKLTGYAPKSNCFNKIRIFFKNDERSFQPQIADSLIASTSLDEEYFDFILQNDTRQIDIQLLKQNNTQERFILTGIQVENYHSKLVYSAAGLNGASAKTYLRALNLLPQIASLQPNLVIISLGTNDAYNDMFSVRDFTKNLSKLIDEIQSNIPNCAILLTVPSDHYWQKEYSNPNLIATREAIIKIAAKKGCYTWDLYHIMGGAGSMETWKQSGYSANDMIHFTQKGYNLQAEMLFHAITGEGKNLNNFLRMNH